MIELSWERARRILLVHYAAGLTAMGLDHLDRELTAFYGREGLMDTIIDFTAVPSEEFEMCAVIERAKRLSRHAGSPTRRIFVVEGPLQYGVMRAYGAHQEFRGYGQPELVSSVDEALKLLGTSQAEFALCSSDADVRSLE